MNSPAFKLFLYMVATFAATFCGSEIIMRLVQRCQETPDAPLKIHWFVWLFVFMLCCGQCAINARAFVDGSLARHEDDQKKLTTSENTEPKETKV